MKKIILVIVKIMLILFSIKLALFLADTENNKLNTFTTDWCSMFPDWNWKECCVEHDKSYWKGGTKWQKENADKKLQICVWKKWHPNIGFLMKIWVSIWWTPYLPTNFRWWYWWDKFKNYN